jgi:two-component system sensor kinase FixL
VRENFVDEQMESRLSAILNNAVDAIITIDELGIIESANPATKTLFGYTEQDLIGKNVKILMPPPFRDGHDGYLRSYRETSVAKIIGMGREVVGRRSDGSTFPLHLAVSEIWLGERRIFTGIIRDVSDLKEAERRLQELNEVLESRVAERTRELHDAQAELVMKEKLATLGQVSGGIAHEIRNPLNAVKTSIYYLMHAKHRSPEKTTEHLERIDRQVTLIDNVITALSDVARMPEPNRIPVRVEDLVLSIVNEVGLPVNIEVTIDIPLDLFVLADEHQIPIVLRNIVRNARDAMPEGGTLEITASEETNKIRVNVCDSGTGIPPGQVQHIMEPLYSTKARGMGLGLAISRAIVDKNGGELIVESEIGVGSTFTVILAATQGRGNSIEGQA